MTESTARHGLPLLAPGQAQKEMSHNEALAGLDIVVQAAALGTANVPPGAPAPGQCWIVGAVPTGAWAGHGGKLAAWTAGGWRFAVPTEGMTVMLPGASGFARCEGGGWSEGGLRGMTLTLGGTQVVGAQRPAIASPSGGTSVDTQARAAVAAILGALRTHGLIAT